MWNTKPLQQVKGSNNSWPGLVDWPLGGWIGSFSQSIMLLSISVFSLFLLQSPHSSFPSFLYMLGPEFTSCEGWNEKKINLFKNKLLRPITPFWSQSCDLEHKSQKIRGGILNAFIIFMYIQENSNPPEVSSSCVVDRLWSMFLPGKEKEKD